MFCLRRGGDLGSVADQAQSLVIYSFQRCLCGIIGADERFRYGFDLLCHFFGGGFFAVGAVVGRGAGYGIGRLGRFDGAQIPPVRTQSV